MKNKNNLAVPLIITAALLFYIFTSATMQIIDVNKTGAYNATESYTILEPYNETEYYMEKVPYGNLVNCNPAYMNFTEEFSRARKIVDEKIYFVCTLKVTNDDIIAENWTYFAKFTKEDGYQFDDMDITKEILPGQTAVFEWSYLMKESNATVNCEYKAKELPKTTVCRSSFYQEVNATRTVTKYRNVTQTRTVEKYDFRISEEPAYFNRFFGYKQCFYLGY